MTKLYPARLKPVIRSLACILAAAVLLFGCASSASQTNLMKKVEVDAMSAEELRIRVRALAGPFSGIMEETGDRIRTLTDDSVLRHRALRWKIDGLPAFQTALFQPDPLAALLDAWALILQIRYSFDTGAAAHLPAEIKSIVNNSLDLMEDELVKVAGMIGPEGTVQRLRSAADDWAKKNPLRSSLRTRPPTTSELAAITANARVGLRGTVTALKETMRDMATRIDVYTTYLPKQARWQAEYLLEDTFGEADIGVLIDEFTSFSNSIEEISKTVEELPELVTAERTALLRALQEERIAALESIHKELANLFEFITQERIAALSVHLKSERIAIMEGLTSEMTAALEAIRQERIETMAEFKMMTKEVVEESLKDLVDHIFLRLAQGILILLIVGTLLVFLFFRYRSRRQRAE